MGNWKSIEKYDALGIVDDILVLENKLSSTTPLTSPQSGALKSGNYRKILTTPGLNDSDKYGRIQDLIQKVKTKLETDVLLGTKDVNQIINF